MLLTCVYLLPELPASALIDLVVLTALTCALKPDQKNKIAL